jgi:hypothetical protein
MGRQENSKQRRDTFFTVPLKSPLGSEFESVILNEAPSSKTEEHRACEWAQNLCVTCIPLKAGKTK